MNKNRWGTLGVAIGCLSVALAAQGVPAHEQSDIEAADKAKLEQVHPAKPAYSPYAGRNVPTLLNIREEKA